jgi:hypothetical protein
MPSLGYALIATIAATLFIVAIAAPFVLADDLNTEVDVDNELPVASGASLNTDADIDLTSNQTTSVPGVVTITDSNGCSDLDHVTGYLYRSDVGRAGDDDNQDHYTVFCSSNTDCEGGPDVTETFTCDFTLYWYADATDAGAPYENNSWIFEAIPYDTAGAGTADNASQEVNTLTAVTIYQSSIDFGSLSLGGNTSTTDYPVTLLNLGNTMMDLLVNGYGDIEADGSAMLCDLGAIDDYYLQYAGANFTYGAGTSLTSELGPGQEYDFNLSQGSEATPWPVKSLYLGLGLPASGLRGFCAGTLVLTATV